MDPNGLRRGLRSTNSPRVYTGFHPQFGLAIMEGQNRWFDRSPFSFGKYGFLSGEAIQYGIQVAEEEDVENRRIEAMNLR